MAGKVGGLAAKWLIGAAVATASAVSITKDLNEITRRDNVVHVAPSNSSISSQEGDTSGWLGDLSDIELLETSTSGLDPFNTVAPDTPCAEVAYRRTRFGRHRVLVGVGALGVSATVAGILISVYEIIGSPDTVEPVPRPPGPPLPDNYIFARCKEHNLVFHLTSKVGCPRCFDLKRSYLTSGIKLTPKSNPELFRGEEFIPQAVSASYLSVESHSHKWLLTEDELVCSCGSNLHRFSVKTGRPVFLYEPSSLTYFVKPTSLGEVLSSFGYVIGTWRSQ